MLFNSAQFLIFLPVTALIYYILPHKIRYVWLLICSYYFYMCWNPAYALLMLFSTAVTYLCALALHGVQHGRRAAKRTQAQRDRLKKICVAASFTANLGVLAYFKYSNFFIENINALLAHLGAVWQAPTVDVLLPVGISFYTFQALGYTVDVYRGEMPAQKNFLKYALFVSFFPQLVAGPIERSANLLRQFDEKHTLRFSQLRSGFMLMLWGYFLKLVIADRAAIFVNAVYNDPAVYTGWYQIVASVLFAFQIYCDFAGYSIIARGAAEMMGFRLIDNFNAPYLSLSVSEFWRRWHISLSGWFRDYLYIPLGGSRCSTARRYFNLLVVLLTSGLWHGAQWAFVFWGLINGLYQIIGHLLSPVRDRLNRLLGMQRDTFSHKLLKTLVTFILIDITWVFFRAERIDTAFSMLASMFTADNLHIFFDDSLFSLGLDWKNFAVLLGSIALLMGADVLKYRGMVVRECICRQEWWLRWLLLIGGVIFVIVFGVWGSGFNEAAFIYFQF